jgi:lysophospholipase L1-like esterase
MHPTRKLGHAFLAAVAVTVIACGAGATDPAASSSALGGGAPAYLALGDSVAFGFDPLRVPPKPPAFFVGYPTFLAEHVDAPVVNAACPGQTSSGFLSLQGTDNGCFTFRFVEGFDLHVAYDGSQVAFAEDFLRSHPRTWLVTLQLGANDLFLLQQGCATAQDPMKCVVDGAPAVLHQLSTNLAIAILSLRGTGYAGQIILVGYYSPSIDPSTRAVVQAMNGAIEQTGAAFGVETADVFSAFDAASGPPAFDACAAGLLIPLPTGGCDIHPTQAGAELIAQTIEPLVVPRAK